MVRAARLMDGLIEARFELAREHSLGSHISSNPLRSVGFGDCTHLLCPTLLIKANLLDDALYGVGDHRGLRDHDEMTGIRYHNLLAPTGRMGKRRAGFNPRCKGAQLIAGTHRIVRIEPLVPI